MAMTKRQMETNRQREMVVYFKALGEDMGYSMEELATRLGMCRQTLARKYKNPKDLTIGEVDKICQILHPDKQYEERLRGLE